MPEFHVTIQTSVSISARNMEQADERAAQLLEWFDYNPPKAKKWTIPEQEVEFTLGEIDEA